MSAQHTPGRWSFDDTDQTIISDARPSLSIAGVDCIDVCDLPTTAMTCGRRDPRALTQARLRELLSYEPQTGEFAWIKAPRGSRVGPIVSCLSSDGYERIKVDGCTYTKHRLAWLYVTGNWPEVVIDHINREKTDNRFCNLRDATLLQNRQNEVAPHSRNKLGVRGVVKRKGYEKYLVSIMAEGKRFYVGAFPTIGEAASAYVAAKEKHHAI